MIYILLPAYNKQALGLLFPRLRQVIQHPRNMGLAAALRTGLTHIASLAQPDDVIVTMDADNTHNPGLIPCMMQRINEGFDVVIASRFARPLASSACRRFANFSAAWAAGSIISCCRSPASATIPAAIAPTARQ